MRWRAVDPRDTRWEIGDPAYRVHFFQPHQGSWASDEYEVTGADVTDVLAWAKADGRIFVLYALVTTEDGPGLIRLLGTDPNAPAE